MSAGPQDRDHGRSVVEVLVLGVLLLVPLVYVLFVVIRLQAASLAVAQAARDVARVMDSAPTVQNGLERSRQIAEVHLKDHGLEADRVEIFFVDETADCTAAPVVPSLRAGAVWTVCVRAVVTLPGVPSVLSGSDNAVTGAHVLHVGELRES